MPVSLPGCQTGPVSPPQGTNPAYNWIAVLVGITYGIQPYGSHVMGWTSPLVLTLIIGGLVVLAIFCYIETKVEEPMFRLSLFRIRPFTAGNVASLLSSRA